MRIDGDNVRFKSVYPYFAWERDGEKPNTVRVVPVEAVHRLCHCKTITLESPIGETFTRRLTNVVNVTGTMEDCAVTLPEGKRLVCFSWSSLPESLCDSNQEGVAK